MDKTWMLKHRNTREYVSGVNEFIEHAIAHYSVGLKIPCPCVMCGNLVRVTEFYLKDHLIRYGITTSYKQWIWHGEVDNESNVYNGENESNEGDRLEDMLRDIQDGLQNSGSGLNYLLSDAKEPLYGGCSKFSKLSSVVKLYNIKAANGWSDKSFTDLLGLLKDMLPNGNKLPSRVYDAKKMLTKLGMTYEKIHACPNDCVLYRKEYATLESCPSCKAPRYKKENVPAKVLWYFPIIPRLLRMFSIPEIAKLLRWHETSRSKDGMVRHPADSPQCPRKARDPLYCGIRLRE